MMIAAIGRPVSARSVASWVGTGMITSSGRLESDVPYTLVARTVTA
jgi:hypothetical protein